MKLELILNEIDAEISRLKQAKAILTETPVAKPVAVSAKKKTRNLTPEGRKRIADAVRRRWAKQKKAA